MQTFLPLPDLRASAEVLDYRRLGKQRVEARQILNALRNGGGWAKHPAVLMWAGCENALIAYGNVCITEWIRQGYNNNMPLISVPPSYPLPSWFGDDRLHASHRSSLLRKDFAYYSRFCWPDRNDLPYYWPK